jgi:hypothetical protein
MWATRTTTAVLTEAIVNMEGKDYVFIRTEGEEEGTGMMKSPAHKEEAEPAHKHTEGEEHDHAKENKAAHAKGEDHGPRSRRRGEGEHKEGDGHDHGKEKGKATPRTTTTMPGSMTFQRVRSEARNHRWRLHRRYLLQP